MNETSRVLVIDDEEQHYQLLKVCLGPMGFELGKIDCLDDVVKTLREGTYQALIVDYLMPRRNGLLIAELIRDEKDLETFPIILLTSKRMTHEETKKVSMFQVNYMRKPFVPQVLSAKLREVLGRSNQKIVL